MRLRRRKKTLKKREKRLRRINAVVLDRPKLQMAPSAASTRAPETFSQVIGLAGSDSAVPVIAGGFL